MKNTPFSRRVFVFTRPGNFTISRWGGDLVTRPGFGAGSPGIANVLERIRGRMWKVIRAVLGAHQSVARR